MRPAAACGRWASVVGVGRACIVLQGRILAVWILAAKLPNSDLNFAVDFLVDFFLLFFPRKKARKNPPKNPPQNSPGTLFGKFPPRISAEAFS